MGDEPTNFVPQVDFTNPNRQIIRCRDSGVVIGEIIERNGGEAVIRNAQVIWGWEGSNTLVEIANNGVKRSGSKISQPHFSDITVTDVIQIIPIREGVDLSPCWN